MLLQLTNSWSNKKSADILQTYNKLLILGAVTTLTVPECPKTACSYLDNQSCNGLARLWHTQTLAVSIMACWPASISVYTSYCQKFSWLCLSLSSSMLSTQDQLGGAALSFACMCVLSPHQHAICVCVCVCVRCMLASGEALKSF